jgi:hypothetical protein
MKALPGQSNFDAWHKNSYEKNPSTDVEEALVVDDRPAQRSELKEAAVRWETKNNATQTVDKIEGSSAQFDFALSVQQNAMECNLTSDKSICHQSVMFSHSRRSGIQSHLIPGRKGVGGIPSMEQSMVGIAADLASADRVARNRPRRQAVPVQPMWRSGFTPECALQLVQ